MKHDAENFRWIEAKSIEWNYVTQKVLDAELVGNVENNQFIIIDDDPKYVLGDYPVFCIPVISLRAKKLLEEFWKGKVEFIKIKIDADDNYYVVNVLNVLDILDLQNSDVIMFPNTDRIMIIKEYSFFEFNDDCTSIFKIKGYERGEVFINEAVYHKIISENLQGFELVPTDIPYVNPFQELLKK